MAGNHHSKMVLGGFREVTKSWSPGRRLRVSSLLLPRHEDTPKMTYSNHTLSYSCTMDFGVSQFCWSLGKCQHQVCTTPRPWAGHSSILRSKGRQRSWLREVRMEVRARPKGSMCESVSSQVSVHHSVLSCSLRSASRASCCPLSLRMHKAINLFAYSKW